MPHREEIIEMTARPLPKGGYIFLQSHSSLVVQSVFIKSTRFRVSLVFPSLIDERTGSVPNSGRE